MELQGLVALVTGATSGLGRAMALLFAREGAAVAVCGRSAERGAAVVQAIAAAGGRAAFFAADVTDPAAVAGLVAGVLASFGRIDILVNNAGISIPGTVTAISPEQWAATWQANVTSAYLCSYAVVPHMLERRSGSIIHVASGAALKGQKSRAAYCASKAALVGLTKAMAVDHSADGVRVNCLCPGVVETEMVRKVIEASPDPEETRRLMAARRLTPYPGTPEEVARAALFFASPRNVYTTGAILSVDGGTSVK